jgi:hypothetical protein
MSYHPSGITSIKIVGTEVSSNGRACGTHNVCGSDLCDAVVVRLRKVQILNTDGAEETAIAAYLVSDGIDQCRVGFLPRHLVSHAKKYDGALAQITELYTRESKSSSKRKKYHHNRGCCVAAIISSIPLQADSTTPAPSKGRQALEPTMDDRLDVARNAAQQGSTTTAGEASEEDDSMASLLDTNTSVQTGKYKAHEGAANSSMEGAPAKKIKHTTAAPESVTTTPRPNDGPSRVFVCNGSRDEDCVEKGEEESVASCT